MKEKIILVGGGGHCKSCIEVIESENKYVIVGIVDIKENIGIELLGYKVIGCDDDIPMLAKKCNNFIITLGYIKSTDKRLLLFHLLKDNNVFLPVIKASTATISKHSQISEGTIVMHNAIVNSGASVGANCIINTGAVIEHDVIIGADCHVSTNAVVNGMAQVADSVFIGSNSTVIQGVSICERVIIGAGAVVVKDITEYGVYAGIPAKKIK